ncbi:MAG: ATPase, partial [Deltaproteobacteria bacterium]
GEWTLGCFFTRLVQEELNWLEFCAERLVGAVERYVLVQQVRQQGKENKINQGQLITMEKMAAIGLLASGVAHEISNPAGYVRSNLGVLEGYLEDFRNAMERIEKLLGEKGTAELVGEWEKIKKDADIDAAIEDLGEIAAETKEGIERIITIASNLRTFARNGGKERKRFQVQKCIESSLTMVMYKYKSGIELVQDYRPVPDVLGNPAEVGQVLMNLMVNAAQAMNGSGIMTIRTRFEDDWVKASISDTGPGIPPELQEKIFEPLFTTKEPGQGTGLGLAISREIIERHGGKLTVDSTPGRGATFTIWLPPLAEEE